MDLQLKSLQYHGSDHKTILIKLAISFAWEDEMVSDSILITYSHAKHDAQVTLRAQYTGIGIVASRIIEVIADINFRTCTTPPLAIIEKLAENLHLKYNHEEVDNFFNSK